MRAASRTCCGVDGCAKATLAALSCSAEGFRLKRLAGGGSTAGTACSSSEEEEEPESLLESASSTSSASAPAAPDDAAFDAAAAATGCGFDWLAASESDALLSPSSSSSSLAP